MTVETPEMESALIDRSALKMTGQRMVNAMIGKYVVVRTYSAGVHVGVLESHNGSVVTLTESKRIWSWTGANTLNEIANHGVQKGSRVSESVVRNTLSGAIETLECSNEGEANLRASSWMK